MPEPDFDQIAEDILEGVPAEEADMGIMPERIHVVADMLRQIWNDRGAADIEALEAEWSQMPSIDHALRKLDR